MNDLDLDPIRKRVQSLPNSECKWKRDGLTVLDIRDRPVLEITSYLSPGEIADFCANAPEDIGLLLTEVERLQIIAAQRDWQNEYIHQLERERDEALARCKELERLQEALMV